MLRSRLAYGIVLALVAALGAYWIAQGGPGVLGRADGGSVSAEVLALQDTAGAEGFARAYGPRAFAFPQDHGPHPDYQTEWWYYTGNLETAAGRHLGYQLTFFRRALTPPGAGTARSSDWATNQVYFAHFAVTDVAGDQHFSTERFSRGAAGLAGASGEPYQVWLENWSVVGLSADSTRVRLRAADGEYALDLTLTAEKPLVLEGDAGFSPKSDTPGNASYYVSFTRLATQGTVTVGGEMLPVSGLSWMDHEWSTSALSQADVGWDWFSVQLSDRREIMVYQLRRADGSIEPVSGGTLVAADGSARQLRRDDVAIAVRGSWTSPHTGVTYPSGWELSIPSAGIDLTLTPYIDDQEVRVSLTYWEGAVRAEGTAGDLPVAGSGYVELTGYATAKGATHAP